MRGPIRDDSGLVAVMVAVFSLVMFVLAALVVDLGMARETSREAQIAADAAALAGAGELYADDGTLRANEAIATVKDYVGENYGTTASDWSSCSVSLDGGWSSSAGSTSSGTSCIAFADSNADAKVDKLRVVVPAKHSAALFGGLLGYTGSDIGAQAEASTVSSAIRPCALCVFGELKPGSADVSVTGGGSAHAGAGGEITSDGSLSVASGGTISFTGSANPPSGPQYSPNPPVTNSGVAVANRYQGQAMPPTSGVPDSGSNSVACGPGGVDSLTPGRYDDIVIKNVTCNLAAGLYVITGKMEMNSADSRVTGNGVTLFFTCGTRQSPSGCGSGSAGGFLDGSRKGVTLGSPYFGGFSLLYEPGNTSDLVMRVGGASDPQSFGGAIYAKSARMVLEHGQVSVAGPVVVGGLELAGGAMDLSVHAPGLASLPGPPEILLTK
jgi:Putative Flp pilus-assembly TadE/G-like